MHYIRLLRAPRLRKGRTAVEVEIVFTVTTDLGDAFLAPETPVQLQVWAEVPSDSYAEPAKPLHEAALVWSPGMRVAKRWLVMPPFVRRALSSPALVYLRLSPDSSLSADTSRRVLNTVTPRSGGKSAAGLIMPARVALNAAALDGVDVMTRAVHLDGSAGTVAFLEVEEEMGESIARHVWDAGLVAASSIANLCTSRKPSFAHPRCTVALWRVMQTRRPLNVIELGCGVGILGLAIAAARGRSRAGSLEPCQVLMTDLEEAETRARSNMARAASNCQLPEASKVRLQYENLDWEDGRHGCFGPKAGSGRWDVIALSDCTYNVDVLPALVETLSALHLSSLALARSGKPSPTQVFLARKRRHDSEEVLFSLLEAQGWKTMERDVLPLPVLGAEEQTVELHLFERG